MKHLRKFGLAVACGLALAAPAHALTDPLWSSTANGCVPSAVSINSARYTGGNYIFHNGANLDPIILNCPVTVFASANIGYRMRLTYMDSTGVGTGASVVARLYKQSRLTGTTSLVVSFNSNTQAPTGVNVGESTFVPGGFNFTNNAYFVRIVLDRTTSSQTVRAYSVLIEETEV